MNTFDLKRGDTLSFVAKIKNADGTIATGISTFLKCELRTQDDKLIDSLSISETEILGSYILRSNNTSNYPIGMLYADIQRTINTDIFSSATFYINIVKDITR